jgi:hypothetical protein
MRVGVVNRRHQIASHPCDLYSVQS